MPGRLTAANSLLQEIARDKKIAHDGLVQDGFTNL
jgi:hypothetical protein